MVNSGNPSKDRVTIRSCYSLHEASQKPISTVTVASNEIFRLPLFRPKSTPIGAPLSDLHSSGSLVGKQLYTSSHAPISGPTLKFTSQRVAEHVTPFLHAPPPEGATAADKLIHPLHMPYRRRKSPSFSGFLFDRCYCVFLSPESPLFLCFLKLYDIFRTLGVVSVDFY